jgi:hypothetical protein
MSEMTPEEYLAEIEEEQPARKPRRFRRLIVGAIIDDFELFITE